MMSFKDVVTILIISVVVALAFVVIVIGLAQYLESLVIIPQCHEDVVLVGIGDFENGRWDSYTCGPAVDDFEGYYD